MIQFRSTLIPAFAALLVWTTLESASAHSRGGSHGSGGHVRSFGSSGSYSRAPSGSVQPSGSPTALPAGSTTSVYGGSTYHYHEGHWYRPYRGYYYSVVPPIGIYTAWLPPYYSSLWYDGSQYLYYNGIYYRTVPNGYVVAAAPPNAPPPHEASVAPSVINEWVVYARNGQSESQQTNDRAACNAWAEEQAKAATDPSTRSRAFTACMDGRGYTVR